MRTGKQRAEKEEEKGESRDEEKAESQGMRWADCEDDEGRMEQVMLELVGLEIDEGEKEDRVR